MALQRMVRRVAEAAQGTGEAVKALEELGINAQSLNRLSPEKQFERISEAFRGIGNQSDKVRLAMKLFDSEGVALVNTLGLNLEKTGQEFDRLGIAINNSQAQAAEAFTDSFLKMRLIATAFFRQLAGEAAPAFTALIDRILKVVKEMGGMQAIAKNTIDAFVNGFNRVMTILNAVATVIDGINTGISLLGTGLKTVGALSSASRTDQLFFPDQRSSLSSAPKAISTGGTQPNGRIAIIVSADNDAVLRRIETSQGLQNVITTQIDRTTKNAARQVSR